MTVRDAITVLGRRGDLDEEIAFVLISEDDVRSFFHHRGFPFVAQKRVDEVLEALAKQTMIAYADTLDDWASVMLAETEHHYA